jgi:hypothetical protein
MRIPWVHKEELVSFYSGEKKSKYQLNQEKKIEKIEP